MQIQKIIATSSLFVLGFAVSSVMAFSSVLDTIGGPNDNAYASGRIVDEMESTLASWSIITTVADSDFDNDSIVTGDQGLTYIMRNDVLASTSTNVVTFSVVPTAVATLDGVTITQSPYDSNSESWNGGNDEAAQFELSWLGGGMARVNDPDGQFLGLGASAQINSGTLLTFSNTRIFNNEDSWSIEVPAGEMSLEWSSAGPVAGSDLTREWVTFTANVRAVPEPASFGLLGMAAVWMFGIARNRRRS